MHSTSDPGPTTLGAATTAAPATFLDTLLELRFVEQEPRPYAVHTAFQRDDGDRVVRVYCHPDDFAEPSDDGDCNLEVVCFDQGGHRDLWQATFRHFDAVPLALAVQATPASGQFDAVADVVAARVGSNDPVG